jgi:hypothetical protein
MKDRIKSLLVGVGITFGLQVIISLIFTGIAYSAARSETGIEQNTISLLTLGLALGAFLIGGFVVGWMDEAPRVLDAIVVALITLLLSVMVFLALPVDNRAQFVTGISLSGGTRGFVFSWYGMLFVALSIIASIAGAYLGTKVSAPRETIVDRAALVLGLVGAVAGPFILLAMGSGDPTRPDQPNLPWYFLVIVLLVLLVIIGAGFVMFTRESHLEDEISINPDARRQAP